jgi:hypothetical protein
MPFIKYVYLAAALFSGLAAYQNCGFSGFKTQSLSVESSGIAFCDQHGEDSACKDPILPTTCSFNGETVNEGAEITAYLNSSVASGQTCMSQRRTCLGGSLTGNYAYSTCGVNAAKACLFNGLTVASGASVTAFLNSTAAAGEACQSESRLCTNGVLAGSFKFSTCEGSVSRSCLFAGQTIPHGTTVNAYALAQVPAGQTCEKIPRTCLNGALTGSGNFATCVVSAAASCSFNGMLVASGEAVVGFLSSDGSVDACVPQVRLCKDGKLGGSGDYASCKVSEKKACLMNGETIPSGGSVTLFQSPVSNSAGTCAAEKRICTNGVLSGTASAVSCVKVGVAGAKPWTVPGCNTTSFYQDQEDRTLFWGRRLKYSGLPGENSADECTYKTWRPATYRANFATRTMTMIDFVFSNNPVTADGRTLTTAYDPTVFRANGTKYIAFECAGTGFSGTASSCVAPLSADNHIGGPIKVLVDGAASSPGPYLPSASTPKLLTLAGNPYLAWTQVRLDPKAGGNESSMFYDLKTRLTTFDFNRTMMNSDTGIAYDIFTPYQPHSTADLLDLQTINGKFLFSGGRGPTGCVFPLDHVPGCYRLEVGAVSAFAATGALDNAPPSPVALPDNPQEYTRWIFDPTQGWGLLGYMLPKWDASTSSTVTPGLTFIPMANQNTLVDFQVKTVRTTCDPVSQPLPAWGQKNGQCLKSCGDLGGTASFVDACSLHGMKDAGSAYDVPFCCKAGASTCDPATQPAPNYGVRNNRCLPSCGGIGGTAAYPDSCANHGMVSAGESYDSAFCCR